ncbi:MAG: beta-ketoacyl synthase chain length factor, partial [Clostridia bacterium]|nr:beta-ketoacyl synthase chain length factor [Clostridia bacterium]
FTGLKAIDPEPFAPYSRSSGINLGEGAAFFVLEEYEHAKKRGARILAEVFACGLSADAYHQTAPARGGVGAVRSIQSALEDAGLTPDGISYVNGHGTGTGANDVNESLAFREVFGDRNIPLSSTKGATGHCLGAAGAVECAISLLALEADMAPPTIRFESGPDNGINYVPNQPQSCRMEKILSNSFAFGGNNCSLVVGREDNRAGKPYDPDEEIVITGIGCAGTGGADIAQLFETFRSRHRTVDSAYENTSYAGRFAAVMPEVNWKRYIPAPMLRRINEVTRLTMASGKQALTDARWNITRSNMNRTGVIYSTGTGPLETIESINRSILTRGIRAVDPTAFSNSVVNAAPGNFSIACQLKGPITALSLGQVSGLAGVDYAVRVLRHHQADAMVAVCADEICEALQMGFDKLGYASVSGLPAGAKDADGLIIAPGSVSLLLERRGDAKARGAHIYGTIRGFAMVSDDSPVAGFNADGAALAAAAHQALSEADLKNPDLYVSAINGVPAFDRAETRIMAELAGLGTKVTVPQALLGTPVGSAGGYGILSALYSFAEGHIADLPDGAYEVAPDLAAYLHQGENREAEISTALVAATSFGGTCACLVIGKEP